MADTSQAEDERAMLGKLWRQRFESARYAADRARRLYDLDAVPNMDRLRGCFKPSDGSSVPT